MSRNVEDGHRKHFEDLPDEIIIKIFNYLDIDDLISVSDINSHWKELSQDSSIWKDVIYKPKVHATTTERVQLIQKMPALKAYSAMYTENISVIIDTICKYCKEFEYLW